MKIIAPGKLPDDMVARATCGYCKCVFEFSRIEAKFTGCQRDGDFYTIDCPTCKKACHVGPKDFKHPPIPYTRHDR
jgi:hypothetical protein